MARGAKHTIGLALGRTEITALIIGRAGNSVTVPLTVAVDAGDSADILAAGMREVEARLGVSLDGLHADVALLPSLADARMVTLPPLRPAEAEAVIRRDAARYFLGGSGPRVIGVGARRRRRGGGTWASDGGILAAAASSSFLEALQRAAGDVGLIVDSVVPSHACWTTQIPVSGKTNAVLVAVVEDTAHILAKAVGGSLTLRRLPLSDLDEVADSCGSPAGVASVFAHREERARLTRVLTDRGWTVITEGATDTTGEEAAACGARKAELELVASSLVDARRQAGRRLGGRLIGIAAVVLMVAAGLQLWGAHRTLRGIRADRSAIAASVGPLILAQDSLNRLNQRIETIASLTDQSPRWTLGLVDLSLYLPPESYLTGLSVSGDTIEIEAAGDRAGEAIESLRRATNLWDVRLIENIERELENGETVVERYRLSARLVSHHKSTELHPESRSGSTIEEMLRARAGGGGS